MDGFLSRDEIQAILAFDLEMLQRAILKCETLRSSTPLEPLKLHDCGIAIHNQMLKFSKALSDYASARTARKRDSTYYDVHRAGCDLQLLVREQLQRNAA